MTTDVLALTALVFMLGVRHGFDPDHLVAIDGLTRSSRSRWSGLFFSLGHGVVVTLIGLVVAIIATDAQVPAWTQQLGAWISIGVLLVLGIANLLTVLRARPGERVSPVGIRGRWLAGRLGRASHPVLVASVGAAFALSFDTISHALLFSLTGASMAGWAFALGLGLVFTLGMVLTDALNGWWVAKLIAGADGRAARASRAMSTAIALLCLGLAAAGVAKHASPSLDQRLGELSPAVGVLTLLVILAAYAVAHRVAKTAPAP